MRFRLLVVSDKDIEDAWLSYDLNERKAAFSKLDEHVRDFEEPDVSQFDLGGRYGDFELVGHGKKTNGNCGVYRGLKGCNKLALHEHCDLNGVNYAGKVYVRPVFYSCDKPSCPVCFKRGWAVREAHAIVDRLKECSKRFGQVEHISLSVPESDYGLTFEQLKVKMFRACCKRGIAGGVMIFHGFRYANREESRLKRVPFGWRWSPHFHVIGYILGGFCKCRSCPYCDDRGSRWHCGGCDGFYGRSKECYKKDNVIAEVKGERQTVFGTAWYQLNHSVVKVGVVRYQVAMWFGVCSKRKLRLTVEKRKDLCPVCGSELVKLRYFGGKVIIVNREHPDFKRELFMDAFEAYGEVFCEKGNRDFG